MAYIKVKHLSNETVIIHTPEKHIDKSIDYRHLMLKQVQSLKGSEYVITQNWCIKNDKNLKGYNHFMLNAFSLSGNIKYSVLCSFIDGKLILSNDFGTREYKIVECSNCDFVYSFKKKFIKCIDLDILKQHIIDSIDDDSPFNFSFIAGLSDKIVETSKG